MAEVGSFRNMSDLYDQDVLLWSEHQADLLRRMGAGERVNNQVDWENVAEEIEALGKSDRRELRNRICSILAHLIKLEVSAATAPRAGWHETILEQRAEVRALLDDSPSLRPTIGQVITGELTDARALALASLAAHNEQPRVDPAGLIFTEDQVLRA